MSIWKFLFFHIPQWYPDIFTIRDSLLILLISQTDRQIFYMSRIFVETFCISQIVILIFPSPNIPHVSGYYTDIPYIPECYLVIFIPDFYRDIFVVFKAFSANLWKALHIKQTPATSFPIQLSQLYCLCSRQFSFYQYMKMLYYITDTDPRYTGTRQDVRTLISDLTSLI
jgi:hypothetical protein